MEDEALCRCYKARGRLENSELRRKVRENQQRLKSTNVDVEKVLGIL